MHSGSRGVNAQRITFNSTRICLPALAFRTYPRQTRASIKSVRGIKMLNRTPPQLLRKLRKGKYLELSLILVLAQSAAADLIQQRLTLIPIPRSIHRVDDQIAVILECQPRIESLVCGTRIP